MSPDPNRDCLVIGASAGGLDAVSALLVQLDPDFPAVVLDDGVAVLASIQRCGGPLWEMDDDAVKRFRCHVGHPRLLGGGNGAHGAAGNGAHGQAEARR